MISYPVPAVRFEALYGCLREDFLNPARAKEVDTGTWQALKNVPQTQTIELQNVALEIGIPPTQDEAAVAVGPNLPWAEAQFRERVAGEPVNPGVTYKDWPYYRGNVEQHKEQGVFSHTYMERFWPKFARTAKHPELSKVGRQGIAFRYGDLNDVLNLLAREPYTRQAYLPIFFPEDTGAHHGERIPCTLGYHFMLRDDKLHCFYPIRSCDFIRHFRDDVYMAMRLVQWTIERLIAQKEAWIKNNLEGQAMEEAWNLWENVKPGNLSMFVPSLHVFQGDRPKLEREVNAT